MKKIIFSFVIIAISFSVCAQKSKKEERREKRKERITMMVKQEEEGVIVNKKHFLGGIKLTSDGYGGFIEKGIAQSIKRSLLFQLEITERKHPKEEKQFNNLPIADSYIYGKTNFFYPVKLGVQEQFLLGNKGNKNGVSVTGNVGGGIALGLLRPYLLSFDSLGSLVYKSYDDNNNRFLSGSNIGGPSFGTGFNKLKVIPGAYLKTGLRFDYGAYNEMVSAIEVGITAEFYSKKIQQMALNKENNFFFGAYFSILFGRRK